MAHLYKKIKNGREYYYIRETQRVYGKPTTINQVYLGTADKVEALLDQGQEGFSPKEFGSVFVLHELNRDVDLVGMVNEILPAKKRTKGPSLGDLIFYAAMNRSIAPTSKRHLASWYETTDIQRISPLRLGSLNSQNFWNHFDRISATDLEKIVSTFFQKVHSLLGPHEEHLLVEATHLSSTPRPTGAAGRVQVSEGREAPDSQPRVGVAVVSERGSGVPLYYTSFDGGLSEARFFEEHLDDLQAGVVALGVAAQNLTIIFNRGIESPGIFNRVDSRPGVNFIAAFPPHFAPELAEIPLKDFRPLPCKANKRRLQAEKGEDQVLSYETTGTFWDRSRRVIIAFDPRAFQKSYQELRNKVQKVRKDFLALQKEYRQGQRQIDPQTLQEHLVRLCQRFNLNPALFQVSLENDQELAFQINHQQLEDSVRQLGKTILITDHEDWGTHEICQAFFDRFALEGQDPEAKNPFQDTLMPLYHWTPSKIRVHLFVCLAALTYLALLCQRLAAAGLLTTPQEAMKELRALRTAIYLKKPEGKLRRVLESVNHNQLAILKAMGYQVQDGMVLPL